MLWAEDEVGTAWILILELFSNLRDPVESECSSLQAPLLVQAVFGVSFLPAWGGEDPLPCGSAVSTYRARVFLGPAPEIIV